MKAVSKDTRVQEENYVFNCFSSAGGVNSNSANQTHGFTIDDGKFILIYVILRYVIACV